MNQQPLKPSWNALVVKPLIPTIGLGVILSLIVGFFLPQLFLGPLVFFLFIAGLQFLWNRKRYEKTEYTLEDEKIRAKTGSYVSDSDTELLWSKIVQPSLHQGFIQKLLFGTANIALETAGQMGAEIVLAEIEDFNDVFDQVLENLDEDVSLTDDQRQSEHTQSGSGMMLDFVLPMGVLAVIVAGLVYGGLAFTGLSGTVLSAYAPVAIAAVIVLILPFSLYGFLKQTNTTYTFYEHYAVLNVDFMGITRKVIPLSELSDVSLDQPLHKRVIGLSNLGLSVPGMGDAFILENIEDADTIRGKLKQRVRRLGDEDETSAADAKRYDARPDFAATTTLGFLLTGFGLMITLALMTLLPTTSSNYLAISIMAAPTALPGLYLLYKWILCSSVGFAVEGDRVEYDFSFLSRDVTSLSTDKIKAIVKKQGIIQRLFDVYTVSFHSIGTEDDVDFFNLKDTEDNEEMIRAIREQEGSYGGEPQESVTPNFTYSGMVFQNPGVFILPLILAFLPAAVIWLLFYVITPGIVQALSGALATGAVVALGIGIGLTVYLNFYYSNHVSLDLFDDYLIYRDGYFFTREHYVIYDDIRNVEYTEQPFGSVGWLTLDFAGGATTTNDDGNTVSVGGEFTVPHLADVTQIARNLENIFAGELGSSEVRVDREQGVHEYGDELKQTISPSAPPYVIQGLFYGMLVPVFLAGDLPMNLVMYGAMVLGPLGAIGGFIYPKTISYSIKENQVESSQWMLITRTKSVKYQNIDNIDKDRGLTDKIFGTGRVNVSTTGGGGVEFQARYIKDYDNFYQNLQTEYNEARTDDQ